MKRVLEIGSIANEARPAVSGDARDLAGRLGSPDPCALPRVLIGLADPPAMDVSTLGRFLNVCPADMPGPDRDGRRAGRGLAGAEPQPPARGT